jgi:hypothetical protein
MFQVYITASGSGQRFDFGEPVGSLEEAGLVVDRLDNEFKKWEAAGYPKGVEQAVAYCEGCDVYAINNITGEEWFYDGDNPDGTPIWGSLADFS